MPHDQALLDLTSRQELAERRTRPSINDRRLIADRSAKSLRLLATPLRVYRDRSIGRYHRPRRSATLADYLSAPPPPEMDTEEDEDFFDSMLENGTTMEGARINSDLYDAYAGSGSRDFRSPSPLPEDPSTALLRSGPWTVPSSLPPSASTTLSRQPSLRRPVRSRIVDFNDFTLRRRSTTRDDQISRGETADPERPVPREGSWARNPQATRRFFPFVHSRRHDSPDIYPWTMEASGPSNPDIHDDQDLRYSPSWFNLPPPSHLEAVAIEGALVDPTVSDERAHSATSRGMLPRLRRGGLRAPESILSRHASPANLPPIRSDSVADGPALPHHEPQDALLVSEPTSYPTPSTDHELS